MAGWFNKLGSMIGMSDSTAEKAAALPGMPADPNDGKIQGTNVPTISPAPPTTGAAPGANPVAPVTPVKTVAPDAKGTPEGQTSTVPTGPTTTLTATGAAASKPWIQPQLKIRRPYARDEKDNLRTDSSGNFMYKGPEFGEGWTGGLGLLLSKSDQKDLTEQLKSDWTPRPEEGLTSMVDRMSDRLAAGQFAYDYGGEAFQGSKAWHEKASADFHTEAAKTIQAQFKNASADEVSKMTSAMFKYMGSKAAMNLAGARLGKQLTEEETKAIIEDPNIMNLFDATIDVAGAGPTPAAAGAAAPAATPAAGTQGQPTGSAAAINMQQILGKTNPAIMTGLTDRWLDKTSDWSMDMQKQIDAARASNDIATATQLTKTLDAKLGKVANVMNMSLKGVKGFENVNMTSEHAAAFVGQSKENREYLHQMFGRMAAGEDPGQVAMKMVTEHPFETAKQFVTNAAARRLFIAGGKQWAADNPGSALIGGGVALIGVLLIGMMAFNMFSGGGGRHDED